MAVRDDMHQRHRFFVEVVSAGLDPREIENFVDQVEQVHAGIVNVGGIFLINRHSMRAENLAFHHFGKTQDRIQGCPQFVAHLRQKPRFRNVSRFGAMSSFIGDRFRLLEFADQGVFFCARLQCRKRRRMQATREQRKIPFCG